MKARTMAVCILGLLATVGLAQAADRETSTLEQLAWLAGSWKGGDDGAVMEEHWTTPAGGMMVGMHRDLVAGRRALFEFLRIVEEDGEIRYLAMPAGRSPATVFRMVSISERRVVFENPEHDFPQRILYWLDGEEVLHARIEGKEGGQERGMEWSFRR